MKKIMLIVCLMLSWNACAQQDTSIMRSIVTDLASSRLFFEKCYQDKEQYKNDFQTINDENRFYMTKLISNIDSRVNWLKTKAKWVNRGDTPSFSITDKNIRKLNMNSAILSSYISPDSSDGALIRAGVIYSKNNMASKGFEKVITAQGGCDGRIESYKRMEKEASKLFPKPW